MNARTTWSSSPLPAVTVPAAIGGALAADLRGRFELVEYTRYALLDRGSFDFLDHGRLDAIAGMRSLLDALAGVAAEVTGRSLERPEARVVRLRPGDYVLLRHDRVHEDRPVELVLDLSPAPVAGAEVHFRHRGQVFFVVPSEPGALAIVERGPTVMCNHTYVSKRWTDASVVRLSVVLRDPRGE